MNLLTSPRFDHLRRLTDAQGLLHAARGDVPDRFSGYDAVENAAALRLCALGSRTVESELSGLLAKTYFGFLSRGRRYDSGVQHHCDSGGGWTSRGEDGLVQSELARALATVMVSELPIRIRLSASDWWRMLLDEQAPRVQSPRAAANWLIATGQLRAADPGRDLQRVEVLTRWLCEDFYHAHRADGWEWYEPQWSPLAAVVPTGLWHAYHCLGEQRVLRVAQAMTGFVIEHLFEEGQLRPVGTLGTWSRGAAKPAYDQVPAEVCRIVELLCTAERVSGVRSYGDHAELAARWFEGENSRQCAMIDSTTGGCHGSLTAEGPNPHQPAEAILAALLTHADLACRPPRVEEHEIAAEHAEDYALDPSIGS